MLFILKDWVGFDDFFKEEGEGQSYDVEGFLAGKLDEKLLESCCLQSSV